MARVRHVHGGTEKHTQIITCDKMDRKCHAYHKYEVYALGSEPKGRMGPLAVIDFQHGPIKEAGVNGCSNEDLLAIVADRLDCLNAGKFPCIHNAKALACVDEALLHLNDRTKDREARGVEGQHKA